MQLMRRLGIDDPHALGVLVLGFEFSPHLAVWTFRLLDYWTFRKCHAMAHSMNFHLSEISHL